MESAMSADAPEAQSARALPLRFIDVAVCFPAGAGSSSNECSLFQVPSPSNGVPGRTASCCGAPEERLSRERDEGFGFAREFGWRASERLSSEWNDEELPSDFRLPSPELTAVRPPVILGAGGNDVGSSRGISPPCDQRGETRGRQVSALALRRSGLFGRSAGIASRRELSRNVSFLLAALCLLALALGFVWASCAASWMLAGADSKLRICQGESGSSSGESPDGCILEEAAKRAASRRYAFQRAYDVVYAFLLVLSLSRLALVPSSSGLRRVIFLRFSCCACFATLLKFCVSLLTARRVLTPRVVEAIGIEWSTSAEWDITRLAGVLRFIAGSLTSEAVDAAPGWGLLLVGLLQFFWCMYSWRSEPPWLFLGATVSAVALLVVAASAKLRSAADIILSPATAAFIALCYHSLIDEAARAWVKTRCFSGRASLALSARRTSGQTLESAETAEFSEVENQVSGRREEGRGSGDGFARRSRDDLSGCSTGAEAGEDGEEFLPHVVQPEGQGEKQRKKENSSLAAAPASRSVHSSTDCLQVLAFETDSEDAALNDPPTEGFLPGDGLMRLAFCVASLERLFERLAEAVNRAEGREPLDWDGLSGVHTLATPARQLLTPSEVWSVVCRVYVGAPFQLRRRRAHAERVAGGDGTASRSSRRRTSLHAFAEA